MGEIVTWGVVGACVGLALSAVLWQGIKTYLDPERQRKRRAKANQRWVRNRISQNGVMAASINREAEAIAKFRTQLEDPWTHLGSKS